MKMITTAAITAVASKLWSHSKTKYAVRHVRVKLGEMIAGEEMIHRDEIVDRLDNIEGFISGLRYGDWTAVDDTPSEGPGGLVEEPVYKVDPDTGEVTMSPDAPLSDLEALSDPEGWCQGDVPDLK